MGVLSFLRKYNNSNVSVSKVTQRTLRFISYYFQYHDKIVALPSYPTGDDLQDAVWEALAGNSVTYGDRFRKWRWEHLL